MDFSELMGLYNTNPNSISRIFLSDISRMTTIVLTQKIFNEEGVRRIKTKSYRPTYDLVEIQKKDYDFQDDKWIRISMFNSDTKAFSLRKWFRKSDANKQEEQRRQMAYPSIAVVGPTACGKTRRAVELALSLGGEIISADSRQVYRGMSIGTGKDLCEYGEIPYHLIDIADAGEKYNLHRYLRDFHKAYSDVLGRGLLPVICGGTGMYLENAIRGIRLPDVPEKQGLEEGV